MEEKAAGKGCRREGPHCRMLLDAFLQDEEFMEAFTNAPGGLVVHHNYRGGLLEHTVSMMDIADFVAGRETGLLNKDLLLCGAFLHDIGKTREIRPLPYKEYTTEGRLLGHIALE